MTQQPKGPIQIEIETDAELLIKLRERGLKIVEIYSQWCGPCTPILPYLKKARLEIQDDPEALTFIKVCAENVSKALPVLETRKGKSEPLFLVYRNGTLKDTIQGLNAPVLWRNMKDFTPLNPGADDVDENPFVQLLKNPNKGQAPVQESNRAKSFVNLEHLKGR